MPDLLKMQGIKIDKRFVLCLYWRGATTVQLTTRVTLLFTHMGYTVYP
ncbi:MAG: hypothetical protein ACI8RA_002516, partial [Chlamydiales bacterium]